MPNVLSLIGVLYTGADRARALSAYGMVMGLAAVGGQLIGGVLVQANIAGLGWRSCFLINVPVGIARARRWLRAWSPSPAHRGRAGSTSPARRWSRQALTAIVLPLVEGRQHGWPAWTWCSLALRR